MKRNSIISQGSLFEVTRELVRGILRNPFDRHREWSYQGLGMVRSNLDEAGRYRINVWLESLRIPGISCIHTHPWDLKSFVLNGVLTNVRYKTDHGSAFDYDPAYDDKAAEPVSYYPASAMTVGCGTHPNGEKLSGQFDITLYPQPSEEYRCGDVYTQERDEVHESRFIDGTVSLNIRTNKRDDSSATIYWPRGTPWVDAKQREASFTDVNDACRAAVATWEL